MAFCVHNTVMCGCHLCDVSTCCERLKQRHVTAAGCHSNALWGRIRNAANKDDHNRSHGNNARVYTVCVCVCVFVHAASCRCVCNHLDRPHTREAV